MVARNQTRRLSDDRVGDSERGRLLSRSGLDWADRFPAIAAAVNGHG
jgi:hypothetical protein